VLDTNAAAARTREGPAQRAAETSTSARAQSGVAQPRRGVPSSSYRSRSTENAGAQAAPGAANESATARSQSGTPQPRRGVPSTSYRNRAADGAQQQSAAGAQANTTARTPPERVAPAQARQPGGAADGTSTYRSGGGMSQALGRSRSMAQPGAGARTSPGTVRANPDAGAARANPAVSPRASERSTGMPREASRAAPAPRASAAAPEPSRGGGAGAQRAESGGGSYRGDSGGGGGARSAHPAARHVR
jgi:hypothetical protein